MLIAGKDGKCFDKIEVAQDQLCERMDYSFHKYNSNRKFKASCLKDFAITLRRGNRGKKEFLERRKLFLHTTSFKHGEKIRCRAVKAEEGQIYAEKGDIIIARVGRGCVGKAGLIIEGKLPVTDCIYVIKAPTDVIISAWNFITSKEGNEWVKATCHGVCSKVLSRGDVLNMPIAQR
jgi:hypothetical protein